MNTVKIYDYICIVNLFDDSRFTIGNKCRLRIVAIYIKTIITFKWVNSKWICFKWVYCRR